MKVTALTVFRGPNIFTSFPVVCCRLDLEELAHWPTGRLGSAFVDGLLEKLPGLRTHGIGGGTAGGFARVLLEGDGVSLAQVMERMTIELQRLADTDISFGETRPTSDAGIYDVVYAYEDAESGDAAWRLAHALIYHLLPAACPTDIGAVTDFEFVAARDRFLAAASSTALDAAGADLVEAAKARGIPWRRLSKRLSLVQFGQGRFQKNTNYTVTGNTSNIGAIVAMDKGGTSTILAELGLPVPRFRLVHSPENAVQAAAAIGYPVVVKPNNLGMGKGVSVGISGPEEVSAAFARARKYMSTVIVEAFVEGDDYRLLVVGGALVAAVKRVPGYVCGDGVHTVEDLIEKTNRDQNRRSGYGKWLDRLEFDAEAERMLAKAGYTGKTVPPKDEVVTLRGNANFSTGGTAIEVTDRVHPDNRAMAILAAEAVGLDVAGVDFLTPDITRSYRAMPGAICEVNRSPGLTMHWMAEGTRRDIAGAIIDTLYPPGTNGRIPIATVAGGRGATESARLLARVLQHAGHSVGLAAGGAVAVDGMPLVDGGLTGPAAERMVLHNPLVDAAVLEATPGALLRHGLSFDGCDVAAVIGGTGDLPGPDALAAVMGILTGAARKVVVLDADDDLCLGLATRTGDTPVCYVTTDSGNETARRHIAAGRLAVVPGRGDEGAVMMLHDAGNAIALVPPPVPALRQGDGNRAALFAAAMAYGLGVRPNTITGAFATVDDSSL